MVSRVAIVTGSTKGIGKSIGNELARNGFNVVINSRNQEEVDNVAKEIEENFDIQSIGIQADISDEHQVKDMVNQTIKKFQQIDVLVNNAGVLIVKTLEQTTQENWDKIIDTNLKGTFLCSREVLPYMISKNSGFIINISSGAGKSGYAGLSSYCASKFGVIGLTESLAQEVDQFGISVVALCPGAVATDMQKQFMSSEEYERGKNDMIQPSKIAKKTMEVINGKFSSGSSVDIY